MPVELGRSLMAKEDPLKIADPRVEFSVNPLGIDTQRPRFSWVVVSDERGVSIKSCRVIVCSSFENALKGIGDVWDSGRVEIDSNIIEYGGPPLKSFTRYFWRVKCWDDKGRESDWSEVAFFETGVMKPEEWRGYWVGGGRYLRKEFELRGEVAEARAYVTGLGYYELRINGRRVGDRVLDPPWSDYDKTVFYSVYDVTDLLKKGKNAIGVILGRGRYSPKKKKATLNLRYFDEPKALLMLRVRYSNGEEEWIYTDESWKCLEKSPILHDDIYDGYRYDARLEPVGWDLPGFNDSEWKPCSRVEPPKGKLRSTAAVPGTKIIGTLKPKKYYSPKPGVVVFDFGQNLTGWVRLKVRGQRGAKVRIRYAELINEDGTLNTANLRGAEATDEFILRGEGVEVLEPKFTYHGFRYAEVTGTPNIPSIEDIEAVIVHADLEPIGSIATSNKLVNDIHRIVLWSLKSNLMNGVQTDCPQRDERMGWLGDAWLSSEAAILNFNMAKYYEMFLQNIVDTQREDGAIADIAPVYWTFEQLYPADPAWGTALIYIPWALYQYYGDKQVLRKCYEPMKRWWRLLYSMSKDGILYFGKYGDWVPPGRVRSIENCPFEIVSTWILYRDAVILSSIAEVLGAREDAEFFKKKAEEIKEAFNKAFLTEIAEAPIFRQVGYLSKYVRSDGKHVYLGGTQTCNALPLASDMIPAEKVKDIVGALVRSVEVEWDKHLNVGIIGAKYVPEVLAKYGYTELAFEAITQESYPGYGYMIKEGATTLWERWEKLTGSGMNSHNHHMFGSVDAWFYNYVAGIKPQEPGFRKFIVEIPRLRRVTHASASVYIPTRGLIAVTWSRNETGYSVSVAVPVGSVAEIHIPVATKCVEVLESGKVVLSRDGAVSKTSGVIDVKKEEGFVVITVGSGKYEFEARTC